MNRGWILLACLWIWACASLPEPSYVPVMRRDESHAAETEEHAEETAAQEADTMAVNGPDSLRALAQSVLFMPFENVSRYSGPWNLPVGVPSMLQRSVAQERHLRSIPVDSALVRLSGRELKGQVTLERALEVAQELDADYVVFGQVEELQMRRFRATVPAGGYRSYEGGTQITLRPVKVIDREPVEPITRQGIQETKQYGITDPAAYAPYEREYFMLSAIEWDSREFHQTLVGQSMHHCMDQLSAALDSIIRPPPELQPLEPAIIDLDGGNAYINVGLADAVRNGDKFGVWDNGRVLTDPQSGMVLGRSLPRRVGVVQVEQVLSDHLSMVRILEGQDDVRLEYSIRAE